MSKERWECDSCGASLEAGGPSEHVGKMLDYALADTDLGECPNCGESTFNQVEYQE